MSEMCPICMSPLPQDAPSCPACGYKLSGSTKSFKPITYQNEPTRTSASECRNIGTLTVVRGPQIDTVFKLTSAVMSIGRSPRCDIFLNDMTVSRRHASIVREGASFRISDTNSYNGVWLNNENIDTAVLRDGDIVQLGVFCLLYQDKGNA